MHLLLSVPSEDTLPWHPSLWVPSFPCIPILGTRRLPLLLPQHTSGPLAAQQRARAALKLDTKTSTAAKSPPSVSAFCIKSGSGQMENQRLCPSLSLPQTELSISSLPSSQVRVLLSSGSFLQGVSWLQLLLCPGMGRTEP